MSDFESLTDIEEEYFNTSEKEENLSWKRGYFAHKNQTSGYHPYISIPGYQDFLGLEDNLLKNLTNKDKTFTKEAEGKHQFLLEDTHQALSKIWQITGYNYYNHCPPKCYCGGYSLPNQLKPPFCHCTVCTPHTSIPVAPSK